MELDQPELEGQLLLNGARNSDNRETVASLSLETTTSFMVHSTEVRTVDGGLLQASGGLGFNVSHFVTTRLV